MRQDDQDPPGGSLRIGGWLPPATAIRLSDEEPTAEIAVVDPDPPAPPPTPRAGRQATRWRPPAIGRFRGRTIAVAVAAAAAVVALGVTATRLVSSSEAPPPAGQLPPPATVPVQPPPPLASADAGLAPAPPPKRSASATAPPSSASPNPVPVQVSYEAERDGNVMSGRTEPGDRDGASNGQVVRFIGNGEDNVLRFTGVTVPDASTYTVRVQYIAAEPRDSVVLVNGTAVDPPGFPVTADWETVGAVTFRVPLNAGANTIEFGNPDDWAPDIDRIDVTR